MLKSVWIGALACVLAVASAEAGSVGFDPLRGALKLERQDLALGDGDGSYVLRRTLTAEGWAWSCDSRLLGDGEDRVWVAEDGRLHRFVRDGEGWVAQAGTPRRLLRDEAGYTLETQERTFVFDDLGQLIARSTRGTTLCFTPGPHGATAVQGPWGVLCLERSAFGPTRAAFADVEVRYGWADGQLVRVERDAQREAYAYAEGRLTRVGETQVGYDAEGRVTSLVGGRIPFEASYPEGQGWICELREGARAQRYVLRGRTLEVSEAHGLTRTIHFDARQRPHLVEVGGEVEASWSFDARGRVTLRHTQAGDQRFVYGEGDRPSRVELPSGDSVRYVYDADGRVLARTQAAGTTRFVYDDAGQLIASQGVSGLQTRYTRDERGYVTAVDVGGRVTRIERSPAGDVLALQHPDGRVQRFSERGATLKVSDAQGTRRAAAYDAAGRMTAFQDEFGRATRLSYTGYGLIARAWDTDGDFYRCSYDEQGQMVALTDAAGNRVRYSRPEPGTLVIDDPSVGRRVLRFDAAGELQEEVRGDVTLRYRHDGAGRLIARTTPRGEERFAYDDAGRLISQAGPDGELRYAYDELGRMTSCENRTLFERIVYRYEGSNPQPSQVLYPWGSVHYRYDAHGGLTGVRWGEKAIAIERTADGRRSVVRYPNGVETRYAYGDNGALSEVVSVRDGTVLSRRAYSYGARSRVTAVTDERGQVTRFEHDRRGRLIAEAGPERSVRFRYDLAGNRTQVEVDGVARAVEVEAGNRISASGDERYAYDARGTLVHREGPQGEWDYEVDVDGRLRVARGEGHVIRYGYAPDGTPLWREVDGERERYLVDRQQVVGEFDAAGLSRSYVRGEGIDDVLASEGQGGSWIFHRDLLSSVTALSDEAGEVVARYRYGAFGEALASEGPAAEANRWRYTGRPLDALTGLYDLRARRYDATLGRFTSPDPSGRGGGLNLYAYAENDPTRFSDPLGLESSVSDLLGSYEVQPYSVMDSLLWTDPCNAPFRYEPKPWHANVREALEAGNPELESMIRRYGGEQAYLRYMATWGATQGAWDAGEGVVSLFQKQTWVDLYEFASELDDWETVKAVGNHIYESGVDTGDRYGDALLNDPGEAARMSGYGAFQIAGAILGGKGLPQLKEVARLAKLGRAADAVEDVADAAEDVVDAAEDVADAGGDVASAARHADDVGGGSTVGLAGALLGKTDEAVGAASRVSAAARTAGREFDDAVKKALRDYRELDWEDEELISALHDAVRNSDMADSAKDLLTGIDDYYELRPLLSHGTEDLATLLSSGDAELVDYAESLIRNNRQTVVGNSKRYESALRNAERTMNLPAVTATEITNGSGNLSRVFTGELDGKPAVFKFDRNNGRHDFVGEIEDTARGLEPYGGPEVYGRVRVQDADGTWHEAVAMEQIDGYDLLTLKRMADAGEPLPIEITPAHSQALRDLTERLQGEGRYLAETNLGDFMLTADPDRPLAVLDMFVRNGDRVANGGVVDHLGAPVVNTVEGLMR